MSTRAAHLDGTMKAVVQDRYGSADVLKLREIERPAVLDDRVLVKVRAASVNAFDWHLMRGEPLLLRAGMGLRRPTNGVRGVEAAGIVEAVGRNVTRFSPGDEVFGQAIGSFAEYARAREDLLLSKPRQLTFEEAAAVTVAGTTALQSLRDKGRLQAGQRVLINGASGGVGTFAVQIAKALGAHVTAVCSTGNVDQARTIGADEVIDYTKEDFSRRGQRYDLLLDIAGRRSLADCRRALGPNGRFVLVGAPTGRWFRPFDRLIAVLLRSRLAGQRLVPFLADVRHEDLLVLKELVEAGKLRPVIDRRYGLSEVPEAVRYVEGGHARAKVVITMS